MSLQHSPQIVTNGLLLCLDAGNRKSYGGTGNVWRDLAGSNNGTLTNGPTFSNANGGSIVFDGVNDYVQINYSGNFTSQSYTVGFFAKHNGVRDSRRTMVGFSNGGDAAYKVYNMQIWDSDLNFLSFVGDNTNFTTYQIGMPDPFSNWHYFTSVITPSTINTYINGINYYNSSSITLRGSFDRIWIGTRGDQFWKGWIPAFTLHNRALSPTEIQQNYNATKGRFRLA